MASTEAPKAGGGSGCCRRPYIAAVVALHALAGLAFSFHYTVSYEAYVPVADNVSAVIALNMSALADTALRNTSNIVWLDKDVAPLVVDKTHSESQILEIFLKLYSTYCETRISARYPHAGNATWCPCFPTTLVGHQKLEKTLPPKIDIATVEKAHPEMSPGGHWTPPDCQPRQRGALIVPYRGRPEQLRVFLHYMIPFLQRQLTEFTIYIVEQGKPAVFNKAALMNAGFLEVSRNQSFDCYFFHDVDTLPEDDRNFYTCASNPRQLGWYVSRTKYIPYYWNFVGGGTAFTAEQLKRINGFSNKFYGWGGEDDDTYYRITQSGMGVTRYPRAVARYTTLAHKRDPGNPLNPKTARLLKTTRNDKKRTFVKNDGINTLKYTVTKIESKPLYTWILVDLPAPPADYHFKARLR